MEEDEGEPAPRPQARRLRGGRSVRRISRLIVLAQIGLCIFPAALHKDLDAQGQGRRHGNLLGGWLDWWHNEDTDYPPEDYEIFKRPAKPGSPVNVWTYIRLDHLYEISEDDSTIHFHLTCRLKWNDTRLRFTPSHPNPDATYRIVKPSSIWHPSLRVLKDTAHNDPLEAVRIKSSGEVTYTAHYDSKVWAEIDFRHYPFDSHKFVVDISSYRYSADRVVLNMTNFDPNRVNLEALSGPMWQVVGFNQKSVPNKRTVYLDNDSVVEIELFVKRRITNPLVVMILPMALLSILSTTPLFISIEKFSDRAAIGATGCFTIVMFFFVVNEYFPKMGYLTWLHYYTIFTNIYIFGAFFATMALQIIHRNHGGETELGWRERSWKQGGGSLVSELKGASMHEDAKSQENPPDNNNNNVSRSGSGSIAKAREETPILGTGSRRATWQCFPNWRRQPDQFYSQHLNDLIAAGFVVGYLMFNTFMFGIEYHRWAKFDMTNPICDEDHWN